MGIEAKNPIAVPKNHLLGRMLAEHYHLKQLHAGLQTTLTAIRQRFWIFGARSIVKKVCHKCIRCFKCNPKGVVQTMADLPANRVTEARPLVISGVDLYRLRTCIDQGTTSKRSTDKGICSRFCLFCNSSRSFGISIRPKHSSLLGCTQEICCKTRVGDGAAFRQWNLL